MRRVIAILIVASMMLPATLVDAEGTEPTSWLIEEVAGTAQVGAFETAIAVDDDGSILVAFPGGFGSVLMGRRSKSGTWEVEVARPPPIRQDCPVQISGLSLVLDNSGSYHMVFQEGDHGTIYYIRDGEEVNTISQNVSSSSAFPSLAIDDNERLHLCYYDADTGRFVYSRKEPLGGWTTLQLTHDNINKSGRTAIEVDGNGMAHILFAANWPYAQPHPLFALNYVTVSAEWVVSEVERRITSYVEGPFSMAIGDDGAVHVAFTMLYYDIGTKSSDVRVVHGLRDQDGEWTFEQPFKKGYLGRFPSIAIDADGGVHISGHCEILDCLKYCYCSPDGQWTIQIVEHTGDTGRYTSLALDDCGRAHISHFDFNNSCIRYVTNAILPTPPRNLKALSGQMQVALSWESPLSEGAEPLIGYTIHKLGPNEEEPTEIKVDPLSRSFVDREVETGSTYTYWLTGTNRYGEGLPSSRVTASPLDPGSSVLPGAPRDLSAVARDACVNLAWKPPAATDSLVITGYLLYWIPRSSDLIWSPPPIGSSGWSVIALPGEVTEYAHTGLTNGVSYYYAVSALVDEGEGEASPIVNAMPRRLPSAPWGLWGRYGEGAAYVKWEPPDVVGDVRITAYRVYRGASARDMELLATLRYRMLDWGLYVPAPTNYTDADLGARRTWYYQVTAENSLGEGPPSDIVRVGPVEPPSAPRDLTAVLGDLHVDLEWRSPADDGNARVTRYTVYRREGGGAEGRVATVTDGRLTFRDLDVVPGRTYDYRVSASNSAGEGPQSAQVSVSLPEDEGPGDQPEEGVTIGGPSGDLFLIIIIIACVIVASVLLLLRRQH